jgi:hypothetical protein
VLDNAQPSFTYVQVDGRELRLRQIGLNGRTIDDWQLSKPAAALSQALESPHAGYAAASQP